MTTQFITKKRTIALLLVLLVVIPLGLGVLTPDDDATERPTMPPGDDPTATPDGDVPTATPTQGPPTTSDDETRGDFDTPEETPDDGTKDATKRSRSDRDSRDEKRVADDGPSATADATGDATATGSNELPEDNVVPTVAANETEPETTTTPNRSLLLS